MKYLFLLLILLLTACARTPDAANAHSAPGGFCAVYPLGSGAAAVREEADGISISVFDDDITSSQIFLCEEVSFSDCEITPQADSLWIADTSAGVGWRIFGDCRISSVSLPPGYRRGIWQGSTLYYTTDDAVRALEGGLVRLIKQMPCKDACIRLWSDLELAVSDRHETIIISSHDGRELDSFPGSLLSTVGDNALVQDGAGQSLVMRQNPTSTCTALPGEAVDINADGHVLVHSGKKLSFIDGKISTVLSCTQTQGDLQSAVLLGDGVLLLDDGGNLIFSPFSSWQPENIALLTDEFATFRNLCRERLASLSQRADVMAAKYGIPICIDPAPYDMTGESQPLKIALTLDALDTVLPCFPREVFSEKMKICIVSANETAHTDCGSFALRRGGEAILVLPAGTGTEAHAFAHNFVHLIDGEVIAACSAFDNWETCNPPNFGYGLTGNAGRAEYAGFFPSEKAMESPVEDRAELFAAACTAGHADIFRTDAMQRKLLRLCTGIRSVFRLEQDPRIFRWEQYLYKTLAPPAHSAE